MPAAEGFQAAAQLFHQLGDGTRIRIFWILCHCEECVINLAAMMEMSSPALSHHLKILKSCHLINSRREGKEVYYTVTKNPQTQALHESIKTIAQLTCPKDH
jgi:DNA-binding transcriptional ArsR family regulator